MTTLLSRIAPESIMIAGAGRALLLQLAHPAVGRGVVEHSNFSEDPLKRFHGTLTYIYAVTNGTSAQRDRAVAWVRRAHESVKDLGGDPPYDAQDPQLQLWVAATLYDSAMLVYENVFGPVSVGDAEQLYREYAILGTALGMPADLWPDDRAAFTRYWDSAVAQLRVDPAIAAAAETLLHPRNVPLWLRAGMPVARLLTTAMLPPTVREMYGNDVLGLNYGTAADRAYRSLIGGCGVVVPKIPHAIRQALMRYYLRRLGGNLPTIEA